MRSAILQPNVPPHVFPTNKATESSKVRPGKPVSERTSSKSKPGSKRKTSETGFDEFGDAGIDDADLALAENGGFENIDDFDDETGPNVSMSRKKQRPSNAYDDDTTIHEPRQLANGKWACNHNCKDKTSCKHLCCRDGLDKRPKPSKAKTSKKDSESSIDPRQTQLSLSVSKKAKTPVATQPPQDQRSGLAPDRNPPRGPEIQNLNKLHSNVKSGTQPVPLLRGTDSGVGNPDPPIVLPRPGQPRSKTAEAAQRAAQHVYSDDFGDMDDVSSLFKESTADHTSTHLNPAVEKESDYFGTDIGDMLDEFPPSNKDDSRSHATMTAQDNEEHGSSLYGMDEDMLWPLEQTLNDTRQSDPAHTQAGTGKPTGPFIEVSDDSALFDLGCRRENRGSTSTIANEPVDCADAMPAAHGFPHGNAVSGEVSEGRPASSDSATKVFMEEMLGTDLFNYIG